MTAALIYKPAPQWPLVASVAAAVLIHLAAVALASRTTPEPLPAATDPGVIIEIFPEVRPDIAEPTPPDEPPPPPPPLDTAEPLFVEPAPPRLPPERTTSPARPLVRPAAPRLTGATTMSAARVMAVVAPRPDYPYEARRQRLTGSGVATLSVDFASGIVSDVAMRQSTGNATLDNAATAAFRRWRFKPGTVSRVQTPITFTLTGASY